MEVRQASETITAVGAQPQANRPVLNALNERLETSLAPRIEQMQKVLAPVRDALKNVADAVSLLSSLPMMADRAPRLAALDDAFNRLEELSADGKQLRGTLRELVAGQNSDVTAETLASLNALTQRIDTRLAKVQANVQGVRDDIAALQVRLDTRKSRLLLAFNLLALLSTLMLTWIVYTQIVVIRHHWTRVRRPATRSPTAARSHPPPRLRRERSRRGVTFPTSNQLAVISPRPCAAGPDHDSVGRFARPLPARRLLISKDNRPQLSAVASPPPGQHLCCAKIIVTAAINGQDKLQLFSCLSKRRERERFFHGCNMFVTAAVHMLDLSPIWHALAIRRALPIASSIG